MEKEHDWLLIGNHTGCIDGIGGSVRVYEFRCKGCLVRDEAFDVTGPPKKRHMMDKCHDDSLHRLTNIVKKRD